MTRQYFPLDRDERMQEWIMLSFLAIFFLTMFSGLYTQTHNIDFDYILVPLLMFSAGCFYFINGLNGLSKGNLVLKYVPLGLPLLLQFILKKWFSVSPEKAHKSAVLSFGILSLLIGIFCLFLGVVSIVKDV